MPINCGPAEIRMHFEESGIIIAPFKLDVYKDSGKLDHARATISREAGDLIDDNAITREPVSIYSEDTRIGRFYLPNDGLDLGMDNAFLKLFDEMQIFQEKEIHKTFSGTWKLVDIMDYIFEQVKTEDKHGILKEVKSTGEGAEEIIARTSEGELPDVEINAWGLDTLADYGDIGALAEYLSEKTRDYFTFLDDDMKLSFEGETALQVINEISEKLSIDIFTKDDGILYVGSRSADTTFYTGSSSRDTYNLLDYTVPGNTNQIKGVMVNGGKVHQEIEEDSNEIEILEGAWTLVSGTSNIHMYGLAVRNSIKSGSIVTVEYDSVEPDILREIAQQKLINVIGTENSGTAEIDVLSTDLDEQTNDIRTVSLNDVLIVPEQSGRCRNIVPGLYLITGIQHKINSHDGWVINFDMTNILVDDVETAAFAYNTSTDEVVEQINTRLVAWDQGDIGGFNTQGFNFITPDELDDVNDEDLEST